MSFLSQSGLNNLVPLYNYDTRSIVFINYSIPNCEAIAQQVIIEARVIIIGSEDDGVTEISKILRKSNSQEVYIFASGSPGCIPLGNSELSLSTLTKYSSQLRSWFQNYSAIASEESSPSLGIYGGNFAVGDVGEEFLRKLTQMTGAKISTGVNWQETSVLDN